MNDTDTCVKEGLILNYQFHFTKGEKVIAQLNCIFHTVLFVSGGGNSLCREYEGFYVRNIWYCKLSESNPEFYNIAYLLTAQTAFQCLSITSSEAVSFWLENFPDHIETASGLFCTELEQTETKYILLSPSFSTRVKGSVSHPSSILAGWTSRWP